VIRCVPPALPPKKWRDAFAYPTFRGAQGVPRETSPRCVAAADTLISLVVVAEQHGTAGTASSLPRLITLARHAPTVSLPRYPSKALPCLHHQRTTHLCRCRLYCGRLSSDAST